MLWEYLYLWLTIVMAILFASLDWTALWKRIKRLGGRLKSAMREEVDDGAA